MKSLGGQIDNARLLLEALQVSSAMQEHYGTPRREAFRRAVRFTRQTRMRPGEALDYGVFATSEDQQREVWSKRDCARLQRRLNPRDWFFVTEDKGIFHQFCSAAGLPVPHCHALLFRNAFGMAGDRCIAPTETAWADLLQTLDLGETAMKPCRHSYGHGLLVLDEQDGELISGDQRFASAADLARHLFNYPDRGSWIVQQRVYSHPDVAALANTRYLQTVRIYTYIDDDGNARVIDGFLKVIGGDAILDNFEHGIHGNFIAPVDVTTGTINEAIFRTPDYHWQRLTEHPRTGKSFQGFQLPDWEHTLEVMREAAIRFRPIRVLGWDVALTPNGPVIVEANIHWDPPNWDPAMVRRIRATIDPRA